MSILITAKELHDKLSTDASNVVVIDSSWLPSWVEDSAEAMYEKEHIPSAIWLDIDGISDFKVELPHMMPTAPHFKKLMEGKRIF